MEEKTTQYYCRFITTKSKSTDAVSQNTTWIRERNFTTFLGGGDISGNGSGAT